MCASLSAKNLKEISHYFEERMEDDRIVLLPSDGDPGAEIELRAVENSEEREVDNESNAARSSDPMDRDPAFIVYVAAVTAAVGGLLFGYDMGKTVITWLFPINFKPTHVSKTQQNKN